MEKMKKMNTKIAKLPTPNELREMRIERGISQGKLAELAGISQAQVARMETGTVNPRMGTVEKVLSALDTYEAGVLNEEK